MLRFVDVIDLQVSYQRQPPILARRYYLLQALETVGEKQMVIDLDCCDFVANLFENRICSFATRLEGPREVQCQDDSTPILVGRV
jgi:hypothetical protein